MTIPTVTVDGLNINDQVTYSVTNYDHLSGALIEVMSDQYAVRDGGQVSRTRIPIRQLTLRGRVNGTSTANLRANIDALKLRFARQGKRLVWGDDGRWFQYQQSGAFQVSDAFELTAAYEVPFILPVPLFQAAAPTADVRTPTLALILGETTKYEVLYAITPGGTARTPARILIVTKTGGPTTTVTAVQNLTSGEGLSYVGNLPALSLLVVDTWTGRSTLSDLTSVVGYYPLHDASGATDMSGHNRPLAATGGVTYLQDATLGPGVAFNGSTGYLDSADAAFGILTSLSVKARVTPSAVGTAGGIAGKASANAGYGLAINAAGQFVARVFASTLRTVTGVTVAQAGSVYDLAMAYDASNGILRLWVNDVLEGYDDGATNNPNAGTNPFRIGGAHNPSGGAAEFFAGTIEDVGVLTGVVFTQAHVDAMYGGADRLGGLPEYNATKVLVKGAWPLLLDPGQNGTALMRIYSEHATTLPTPIIDIAARARYF